MMHDADAASPSTPTGPGPASVRPSNAMIERALGALHTDAMVLADEAYAVFSGGLDDDPSLPPAVRVGLSCEALKTTTRLMHVIAWLLDQRAVLAGEWRSARPPVLGPDVPSDPALCAWLPPAVADIVRASERLAARARALEGTPALSGGAASSGGAESPARTLLATLRARL